MRGPIAVCWRRLSFPKMRNQFLSRSLHGSSSSIAGRITIYLAAGGHRLNVPWLHPASQMELVRWHV